jgi:multidrug efflux pump subunit AcrA (membrane-fusion protein)
VLLAAASAACGGSHSEPNESAAAPVAVRTVAASVGDVRERLEAGGVVAAGTSAVVTSRVMAPVVELRVRAGDRVRTGQVLVVLDDRTLAAETRRAAAALSAADQALAAAQAERAAAAADEKLAAAWHARIVALHGRNAATPQELDEAEARRAGAAARAAGAQARIEQATAQIGAARASSESAATTHGYTAIRAPFGGLITETMTDPGNLATPGAPLVRLESGGARQVEVRIDESRAAYLQPGQDAEVLFESGDSVTGTVAEVARTIAAGERAFLVTVTLPGERDLRSGTFARVRFAGATRAALLVPVSALRRQGQIATVFVVENDVARLRLVQTGLEGDDGVEVLAGLEAGETVVVDPPAELADGRRVSAAAGREGEQ